MDFYYHLRPAPACDPRALLLNDQKFVRGFLLLACLAPMSIDIEAEATDGDLTLLVFDVAEILLRLKIAGFYFRSFGYTCS